MVLYEESYDELLRVRKELLDAFENAPHFAEDQIRKIADVQIAIMAIDAQRAVKEEKPAGRKFETGVDGYPVE